MFFIDSNIIIDLMQPDSPYHMASANLLEICAEQGELVINSVVYAEISIPLTSIKQVNRALANVFVYEDIPVEAAFLAGKAFLAYRQGKGRKSGVLPDFFIGAHALVHGYKLMTRDQYRYKKYFPKLDIMYP